MKMRKHCAGKVKAKVGLKARDVAIAINELASKQGAHPNTTLERKRRIKEDAGVNDAGKESHQKDRAFPPIDMQTRRRGVVDNGNLVRVALFNQRRRACAALANCSLDSPPHID
jgi:hypothetical protein